jgi:Glycosyl transferase family 2
MSASTWVSIIIDNYNYGRFLQDAIDSALNQTHAHVEIVVVDDGSTDNSREVIGRYGDRVLPVFKSNGGMGSAYNVGVAACRGDAVIILDADDMLLPSAADVTVRLLEPGVAKAHWPMREITAEGRETGRIIPSRPLVGGDVRLRIFRDGPDGYLSPPTSGNAWSRSFLERVMPMPEMDFKRHADMYLATLAPVYGLIRTTAEALSCYRVHGGNDYATKTTEEKNQRNLEVYHHRCVVLARHFTATGSPVGASKWINGNAAYSWMECVARAAEELREIVPSGAGFILVDNGQLDRSGGAEVIEGRLALPFLEKQGLYCPDDSTAVAELERMKSEGASFLVLAWPAFWWLQHYPAFARHLRQNYRCRAENERLVVFDLGEAMP